MTAIIKEKMSHLYLLLPPTYGYISEIHREQHSSLIYHGRSGLHWIGGRRSMDSAQHLASVYSLGIIREG